MSLPTHYSDLQKYLSQVLYASVLEHQAKQGTDLQEVILTKQRATQAIKEILNELAQLYENDAEQTGHNSPMNWLADSKYKAGGPNMPTLWLREIADPKPPLTPEQELIKEWADELGLKEGSIRVFVQRLDKLRREEYQKLQGLQ